MSATRDIAIHEAGHCVCGYHVFGGHYIVDAWAYRDFGAARMYEHEPRRAVMVGFAGHEAEKLFGITRPPGSGASDHARILSLADRHNIDADELGELRQRTRDLLASHRCEVRAVATALRSRRYLDSEQIIQRIVFAIPKLREVD
jgi:hypothetical protein